jgi:hypothetical protein
MVVIEFQEFRFSPYMKDIPMKELQDAAFHYKKDVDGPTDDPYLTSIRAAVRLFAGV